MKYYMVEVMRLLSNPSHPAAALLEAWDGPPDAVPTTAPLPLDNRSRPGQVQNRLDPSVVAELVEAYEVGATIEELAVRFRVHRTTVMAHLDRSGVTKRQRGLSPEQADEVAKLYGGGWSLARVGERFQVDAETVRQALRKAGVKVRPRRGWDVPSHAR